MHDDGNNPPLSPRTGPRRHAWRWVAYAFAGYVCWCAALYFYQDRLIFPRDAAPAPLLRPAPGNIVAIWREIGNDERVEAWFLPAPHVRADRPAPAVVYFHGNAELIDHLDYVVHRYHELGLSVLLPEYRGYGASGGRPSQRGIREDVVYFYDELVRRPEVDRSRIVFHGCSLGGGVACDLARQRKPKAMILQSTFASLAEMARHYGVPAFLARHPFRSDEVVATIGVPLLIFHGTWDQVVPVSHGRRLSARAPHAVYIEYDGDHNDWPGRGNETAAWDRIRQLLVDAEVLTRSLPTSSAAAEDHSMWVERNVAYLGPGRKEKLDLYLPADGSVAGRRRPGVVVIHGGGWMKGDKSDRRERHIGTTLAEAGYVCASINYALAASDRPSWPTNLHDGKAAVRFLRYHADRYGVDAERIGVLGSSAGGHLAALVSLTGPEAALDPAAPYPGVSSRVQAAVVLYAIGDLLSSRKTAPDGTPIPPGSPDDVTTTMLGATREQDPARWLLASPIHHVTADDPPMLILHGTADTTVDVEQARRLARKLQEVGVPHELVVIEKAPHSFGLTYSPPDVRGRVLHFFERHLKRADCADDDSHP